MSVKPETRLMTLHALTFLHPGTGQTTGVVDLPVQREVHTGFPMIASSGLKGAMREKAERDWGDTDERVYVVFGPKDSEAAGALALTDARLLLLPVRSLQRVFLWITCPMVLDRLARDLAFAGRANGTVSAKVAVENGKCIPPKDFGLAGPVVLEELRFEFDSDPTKQQRCVDLVTVLKQISPTLAGAGIDKRLLIIEDSDFVYLCRHALQVSARIALNDKKTTTGGGGNLWYEETLPPETVMYSVLLANEPRYKAKAKPANAGADGEANNKAKGQGTAATSPGAISPKSAAEVITAVDSLLNGKYLQVGGNETVGQGWCSVTLSHALARTVPDGVGPGSGQSKTGATPAGGKKP
jgi:CRISPR-associated protein Cmr4